MLVPFVWCILVVVRAYPNSVICVGVCVSMFGIAHWGSLKWRGYPVGFSLKIRGWLIKNFFARK